MTRPHAASAVDHLADVVRTARKAQGLTQAQLAEAAGVGRLFVIELEAGHPRAEIGKAFSVLGALGIDPFAERTHETTKERSA